MVVVHQYVEPRKQKDADCVTCRFSEISRDPDGEEILVCSERMYDIKTLKCYLPKEESDHD